MCLGIAIFRNKTNYKNYNITKPKIIFPINPPNRISNDTIDAVEEIVDIIHSGNSSSVEFNTSTLQSISSTDSLNSHTISTLSSNNSFTSLLCYNSQHITENIIDDIVSVYGTPRSHISEINIENVVNDDNTDNE